MARIFRIRNIFVNMNGITAPGFVVLKLSVAINVRRVAVRF